MNIEFTDFGTIYNYDNNHENLAKKIAKDAKPKTIYLLYSGDEVKEDFSGLIFLHELALANRFKDASIGLEVPQGFVRVYIKG